MAKQTFTAGQVLTAAQVNGLQTNDFNLTVSTKTAAYTFVVGDRGTRVVLNDSTARTFTIDDAIFSAGDTIQVHNINTGVLTIAAGAGVTLNGADVLTVAQYQGGTIFFTSASSAIFFPTAKAGKILQVVSTTKIDTFSTSSTSFVDVTGLNASITPSATSSQVLVIATVTGSTTNNPDAGGSGFVLVRGSTLIAQNTSLTTDLTGHFTNRNLATSASFNSAVTFLDSPATTSATTYKIQVLTTGSNTVFVNRNPDGDVGSVSSITVFEVSA